MLCELPSRASKGRAPGGKPLQILVIHHDPRHVPGWMCPRMCPLSLASGIRASQRLDLLGTLPC